MPLEVTTEGSGTAVLPSESPFEEALKMEEATVRQEGDEGTTTSPAVEETEPENKENSATHKDESQAESKNVEEPSSTSAVVAASTTSETTNGTKEGGSKEKDQKLTEERGENAEEAAGPVVSATKRTRPPYKYDPEKVTLRFLFANKDGLTVTVDCKPGDTVGEVKGQLLSVWPEDLPGCTNSDNVRLICMGKGILMPDSKTLEDCQVPVFKTHPTPINVSVRPKLTVVETNKSVKEKSSNAAGVTSSAGGVNGRTSEQTSQGCGCIIQ